ncbi:DUF6096 family protein [Enterococcus sp. DIV1096b]|jgi:hypothetical protein|uniref:DUF6096 family protein n=1 Tax=unclassified Enterococcus TaxID=2608891 RepID=UPI002070158B|nr:MAG TPA: tail assembly chaperone [Caudoviricetes sp.]
MSKNNIAQFPHTTPFELGNLNLQLRLDGKAIIAIEKKLDEGIMGLFVKKQGEIKLPPANSLLIVLQGANKTSGVTEKAIIEAFEQYIESGKTTMDLFGEINDFLDEAGFFGKKETANEATDGESLDQTNSEDSLL